MPLCYQQTVSPPGVPGAGSQPPYPHQTEQTPFTSSQSEQFSIGGSIGVNVGFFAASVNASYSNRYSFDATGSSAIRAKFVNIPPPAVFNERLRSLIRGTSG